VKISLREERVLNVPLLDTKAFSRCELKKLPDGNYSLYYVGYDASQHLITLNKNDPFVELLCPTQLELLDVGPREIVVKTTIVEIKETILL
jgi:hypothetical protein